MKKTQNGYLRIQANKFVLNNARKNLETMGCLENFNYVDSVLERRAVCRTKS